ncbi:MAG: hypothetical protein GSR73_06130 [Desulfurococcales archaeon]|nr:hypothetical protein [Desulfurococcales archaeon]
MARRGRYVRDPLPGLEVSVEHVDEILFPSLEKALRRKHGFRFVLGAFGDVSLIVKPRLGGRTVGLHHLVIGRRGEIKHYGIKGLRGWSGRGEGDIQFYNRRGFHVEFDVIKGKWLVKEKKR